jgi:peptide/nickel transport system permease protein
MRPGETFGHVTDAPIGVELEPGLPPEIPRSPRAIAWTRRRLSARRVWALYRKNTMGMVGLITLIFFIAVAVFAPLIAPKEGLEATCPCNGTPFSPPSWSFPFGTDNFGRSVFTLTVWGTRISLLVGLLATAIAMLIGSVIGIVAGYYGRWPESVLMRLTDWFLVIPFLPLAIVLAAVLGPSIKNVILVIGITSWPSMARIVRAQVLTLKQRLYVDRSRALGASQAHLMGRHILPSVSGLILAQTTLTVPIAILSETTLAFLGFGDPSRPSWGKMLEEAFEQGALIEEAWWWYIPPGVGIVLVVLAFTLCGRALEEILDPRLRERPA